MKWTDRSIATLFVTYLALGVVPKSCQESRNIEPFRARYEQNVKSDQYDEQKLDEIEYERDQFLRDKNCLMLGEWHVGSQNGKYKAYTYLTPALCLNPFSSDEAYEKSRKI